MPEAKYSTGEVVRASFPYSVQEKTLHQIRSEVEENEDGMYTPAQQKVLSYLLLSMSYVTAVLEGNAHWLKLPDDCNKVFHNHYDIFHTFLETRFGKYKKRPALIISNDQFSVKNRNYLVVPMSHAIYKSVGHQMLIPDHYFTIKINEKASYLNTEMIESIPQDYILQGLSAIKEEYFINDLMPKILMNFGKKSRNVNQNSEIKTPKKILPTEKVVLDANKYETFKKAYNKSKKIVLDGLEYAPVSSFFDHIRNTEPDFESAVNSKLNMNFLKNSSKFFDLKFNENNWYVKLKEHNFDKIK